MKGTIIIIIPLVIVINVTVLGMMCSSPLDM